MSDEHEAAVEAMDEIRALRSERDLVHQEHNAGARQCRETVARVVAERDGALLDRDDQVRRKRAFVLLGAARLMGSEVERRIASFNRQDENEESDGG